MYLAIVILLMLVLPILSLVIEGYVGHSQGTPILLERWLVFWGVGVRLIVAGIRQITKPRFTAETILGLKSKESWIVIRELGFANTAIGFVGIGSILNPTWLTPAAVAGCAFYAFTGINHILEPRRTRLQNIAMVSDVGFAVMVAVVMGIAIR